MLGHDGRDARGGCEHGGHGAIAARGAHQRPPDCNVAQALLQGKDSSRLRRRYLSQAVAH